MLSANDGLVAIPPDGTSRMYIATTTRREGLLVVRDTKPLHFGEANRGFYFGSLPDGLPGNVKSLPDRYAGVLTFDGRELQLAAGPISQMVAR